MHNYRGIEQYIIKCDLSIYDFNNIKCDAILRKYSILMRLSTKRKSQ